MMMSNVSRLGSFAILRAIAQILTFAAGILVVRSLPPGEYALYSIGASLVAAVTAISATGITSRFMSLAAPTARPSIELDVIYQSARHARMRLAGMLMIVIIPLLLYLLLANGGATVPSIILAVLVALCILPLQQYGLTTTELQLEHRLIAIGSADAASSAGRVVLVSLAWVAGWANAISLTLVSTLIAWGQAYAGSRQTRATLRRTSLSDADVRRSFSSAVRQSLPAVLVMVASEQMVTLLLTWSGNTDGIAEVAALSRYALAFALINNIIGTWGSSRLAHASGDRRAVTLAAFKYLAIYFAACVAFLGFVVVFAEPLLLLLGSHYDDLRSEFLILMAGATLTNFASFGIGAVNHSRGYLRFSWSYIPMVAVWLVVAILFVDSSSSFGAAVLTASLALPQLASQLVRAVHGISTHGRN